MTMSSSCLSMRGLLAVKGCRAMAPGCLYQLSSERTSNMVLAALRMTMTVPRFMTESFQFRVTRKPINAQNQLPERDSQICADAATPLSDSTLRVNSADPSSNEGVSILVQASVRSTRERRPTCRVPDPVVNRLARTICA
jgi:hypothetical protein